MKLFSRVGVYKAFEQNRRFNTLVNQTDQLNATDVSSTVRCTTLCTCANTSKYRLAKYRGFWKSKKNQREALEKIGREKFGIKELDDWYSVKLRDAHLSFAFLSKYKTLYDALKKLYPHHDWNPLRFQRVPRGLWKDENAQRDALERLGREKFGVKELDDWYSVPSTHVNRELTFMKKYNDSLFEALKHLYPQHNWDPTRLARVPVGYWRDENTQREVLERLGREKFGVKELDDWYSVPALDARREIRFINEYYNGSLFHTLKRMCWFTLFTRVHRLYPHHDWDPLRFMRVPHGHWDSLDAQREALERLGRKLGVKQLNDWYSVCAVDVRRELSFINTHYNGSLDLALKNLYPHHHWAPFRPLVRMKSPIDAHRAEFERLGREKFGVKELDDWYSVSPNKARENISIVLKYRSLYDTLVALYPDHNWDPFRFDRIPSRFWSDEKAQREALERLGREKFGVKDLDDWYSVATVDLRNELGFMTKYGTMFDALKRLYPYHDWDPLRFQRIPHKYWSQDNIVKYYHDLFVKWKKEFHIRTVRDWYDLPPKQLKQFKRAAEGIFGSRMKMLQEWFPETVRAMHTVQYTSQLELKNLLKSVISDAHLKYHKQSSEEPHHTQKLIS